MKFLDGDGLARVWAKIKQTFAYKIDIKSSDWNAREGEDGYIENRTHYEEIIGRDYKNTDTDYVYLEMPTGASPFDVKFAYYANETFESINDLKNRNLTLVSNGEPVVHELTSVTNHTTYWTAGDGTDDTVIYVINQSTIDGNTFNPGLYILAGIFGVSVDSYELTKSDYIKKLDEKYIPSTIARTTDIPTTDQTYNNVSSNPQSGTAVAGAIANVTALIPTKTSDLTNDGIGGSPADPFITKTVDNLTNYYDKSDIDSMISVRLKIQVVDVLPIQDIDPSTIYLVPSYGGSSSSDNTYEEYVYIIDEESSQVEGHWEMIGTSDVDLTDYMQKSNNLSDVDDRQTALNNLTNASISQAGNYLKVDNTGNVTFGTVATQSQADWNQGDNTQVDYIKNKPNLATVATSGDYSDLSNTPTASINGSTPEELESVSIVKADRTITHQKFHDTTITLNSTDVVVAVPFVDQNFTDPASKNAISVAAVNGALSEKFNTSAFLDFEKNVILRGGEIQGNGSAELIPKTTVNHVNLWASTTTTTYIIKQDPGEKDNYWAALDVDGITDLYVSGSAEKFRMCLTDGTSSYTSAQDIIDFIDSIDTPKTGQGATDRLSLTCSWTSNQAVSTLDNYHITNTNNNKILLMYFGLSNSSLVITTEGLEPAFLSTIDSTSINAVQSKTIYDEFAKYDNLVNGVATGSMRGVSTDVEGINYSLGDNSISIGLATKAAGDNQLVFGKYNIADSNDSYIEVVGNGTADNSRSNARTLDWSGNEILKGDLTIGNASNTGTSTLIGANSLTIKNTQGPYQGSIQSFNIISKARSTMNILSGGTSGTTSTINISTWSDDPTDVSDMSSGSGGGVNIYTEKLKLINQTSSSQGLFINTIGHLQSSGNSFTIENTGEGQTATNLYLIAQSGEGATGPGQAYLQGKGNQNSGAGGSVYVEATGSGSGGGGYLYLTASGSQDTTTSGSGGTVNITANGAGNAGGGTINIISYAGQNGTSRNSGVINISAQPGTSESSISIAADTITLAGAVKQLKKAISTSSCTPDTYYCPTAAIAALVCDDTGFTGDYNYTFSGCFTAAAGMTQMPAQTDYQSITMTWYGDIGIEVGERYMFCSTKVSTTEYVGVVTKLV